MAKANSFEDLKIWQLARDLVHAVYLETNESVFVKDFSLRDQMRRAAVSSMANIAEGFERGSQRDFMRFLYMARGSAGEVRSHLYVARDLGYISPLTFDKVHRQAVEVSKAIFGFIKYLNTPKER